MYNFQLAHPLCNAPHHGALKEKQIKLNVSQMCLIHRHLVADPRTEPNSIPRCFPSPVTRKDSQDSSSACNYFSLQLSRENRAMGIIPTRFFTWSSLTSSLSWFNGEKRRVPAYVLFPPISFLALCQSRFAWH